MIREGVPVPGGGVDGLDWNLSGPTRMVGPPGPTARIVSLPTMVATGRSRDWQQMHATSVTG